MAEMVAPLRTLRIDRLPITIYRSAGDLGVAAAHEARSTIGDAIASRGGANVILASANSQLDFLQALRSLPGIDWPRVHVFHLDEYLGIEHGHRASFPRFLQDHLLDHVEAGSFHAIPSRVDPDRACRDYEALLRQHPADLVVLGFGENGHIAFNDPPYARFDDPVWVKTVRLDEVSRRQQVGEGHFASLQEVPTHAITLTIPAVIAGRRLLCLVPEARKAAAVRACLLEPIAEERPGSVLRTVDHAELLLDTDSAAQL